MAEPAKKKDRKDKKKSFQNQRWEYNSEQTLATGVNTKVTKKKIKARCFNCNKKSHYANNAPNLHITSVGLGNFYAGNW